MQIKPKTMSDDLGYGFFYREEKKRIKEEIEVLEQRPNKSECIKVWKAQIKKHQAKIKQIKADPSLSDAEKEHKIANYMDTINAYKRDIKQAKALLAAQKAEIEALYKKQQTKQK